MICTRAGVSLTPLLMSQTSPSSAESADPAGAPPPLPATPAFSPLYQQIKGLILQSLQTGEWKPGEAIPSEMELSARFRVSQGTVRKAIDELAAENLVVRRQGKGTFVATHSEQHVQYRFLRLMPDSGDLDDEGPAQRSILDCRRVRAAADVARALALRPGDAVMQIRRVLSFKGVPAILEDVWLPGQAFKGLSAEKIAQYPGPTYAMYEADFGVRMVRAVENIRAVGAEVAQGELWWADLPMPAGSGPGFRRPVVVVQGNPLNRSRLATVVCVP